MTASRGSRVVCRRCGLEVADVGRKPRDGKIILRNIQVRVRGDWVKMADNLQIINSKPLKGILLLRTKNGKSKDYCKADSEQRVLFFEHNNISAGHTSLFQVYRCYWTGGGGEGVSKEIFGTVTLPIWRHVSRQCLSKWRAKCSSKRRIKISILSRKYCSDFLDLEVLRFLLS